MKNTFIFIVAIFAITACGSDKDGAAETLKKQGYTHIDTSDGLAWFGCAKEDFWRTEFKAVSPAGYPVEGVVCEGLFFKGSTIRFD